MAAIVLCHVGLGLFKAWNTAKTVYSATHPVNPVRLIQSKMLVNARGEGLAHQIEIITGNGHQYFFIFPVHDQALHGAILQNFPIGSNLNRAGCDHARSQMRTMGVNHAVYKDTSAAARILILVSTKPNFNLTQFKQPHWQAI